MKNLDSAEVLKQVSSKLPSYSAVKWCRHAELKKKTGRSVVFHDLVKFLESEADLATDPIFSPDALRAERRKSPDKDKGNFQRCPTNANSLVTNSARPPGTVAPQAGSCPLCSKGHALLNCHEFRKKSLEERLNLIRSKLLCFGCLQQGHISKDCSQRMTCQRCSKSHPTTTKSQRSPTRQRTTQPKPSATAPASATKA